MNDYPLSTKSSKKSRSQSRPINPHSPLLERSACNAPILRKEVYGHLLRGERIFLEMYYQGRVVSTVYPEYIAFMGALVLKRLAPKVTIFLTNLRPKDTLPIRERVAKICPNCRVVSILWFERCYQMKQKVPFDGFELDGEIDSEQRSEAVNQVELTEFLNNICEDVQSEFKDFLKGEKKRCFENLPKNHNKLPEDIFPIRDFDLGPNPEKKNKQKNDNVRKRRTMKQDQSEKKISNKGREHKSLGPQRSKQAECDGEQEENTVGEKLEQGKKETVSQQMFNHEESRPSIFQNVVTKYLGMQNYLIEQKGSSSATVKSKRTPIVSQNKQTYSKQLPSQKAPTQIIVTNSIISKKTVQSNMVSNKESKQNHRYTFSKVGNKYRDLHKCDEHAIDIAEVENSLSVIAKGDDNLLLVMTASTAVQHRIKEINQEATHHSAITFHHIKYHLFTTITQRVSHAFDLYFLINPKKTTERAFFLALILSQSPIKVKLVNHRLIDEVTAYNMQIKGAQLRSPLKLQRSRLRFIKEISYKVLPAFVKGKKIAFIQSELPCNVQKRVVQALGGFYISKENYLLNESIDLMITDRCWVHDKGTETVAQDHFWRKVIVLEGEDML